MFRNITRHAMTLPIYISHHSRKSIAGLFMRQTSAECVHATNDETAGASKTETDLLVADRRLNPDLHLTQGLYTRQTDKINIYTYATASHNGDGSIAGNNCAR
jgi:hypothetical protein